MNGSEKSRIENVDEARERAERVEKLVGGKIDVEFQKLKLAQEFGMEEEVDLRKKAIQELHNAADESILKNEHKDLLKELYQAANSVGEGVIIVEDAAFREGLETRFGRTRHLSFNVEVSDKEGTASYAGITPGEYLLVPDTVFVLRFEGNKVFLLKNPFYAEILRRLDKYESSRL